MIDMKRKLLFIFSLFVFCFSINVFASTNYQVRTEDNLGVPDYIQVTDSNKDDILSTPLVDSSEKIYDFGELLTDGEEKKLYDEVLKYISEYKMDMVIVTLGENVKKDALAYAQDFYDYNTFGISDSHDGILFLIDMDTRQVRISTTGKAIDIYTDDRIEDMLDNIFKYMPNNYYKAAAEFIKSSSYFASIGNGDNSSLSVIDKIRFLPWSGILIFAFVSTIIVMIVLVRCNKLVRKANSSSQYLVKDSTEIDLVKEEFLGTTLNRTKIVHDSGSSSGGGGSSISTGSSGVSHGGGGRSF